MIKRYLALLLLVVLSAMTAFTANKRFTLVIDAGHGGHDAGAIGTLTKEKIINLNVALAFGRLVERNCPDVKVIYTRKSDVFVPLHTRADIANNAKADLFISVHTNSMPKSAKARKIHGIETYTLGMHRAADNLDVAKRENSVILIEQDYKQRYQGFDPNSSESYIMFEFIQDRNMAQSVELAKAVQKHLCSRSGRENKGVKQAGFLVLRETSMPSCLIELGFISNPDEEHFLHSSSGVERLARGIYDAFVSYRQSQGKRSVSVPLASNTQTAPVLSVQATASAIQPTAETPTPQVPEKKTTDRKKKKKNALAQELSDILEGRSTGEVEAHSVGVDPDSVLSAMPDEGVAPLAEQAPAQHPASTQDAQQPASPLIAKQSSSQPVLKESEPRPKSPSGQSTASLSEPIFKVQILASSSPLKADDAQLKGQKNIDFYRDGGLYKYTVGASANYNEIYRLRKTLVNRFPQCFIIAFQDGQRTDVQQAIRQFKRHAQ